MSTMSRFFQVARPHDHVWTQLLPGTGIHALLGASCCAHVKKALSGAWIREQECLTKKGAIPRKFLGSSSWKCPECRTEQRQRPKQLERNFLLESNLKNFIESDMKVCATHALPKKLCK